MRLGPGATGVLQSALGNLPELFICIFSLKAGLVDVVRAALVGSILANLLLVLGLAFLVGGLKHGPQQLGSERARTITTLMLLSVTAMAIPSLAHWLHTPADAHESTFSIIVSVVLIALFLLSLPFALKRSGDDDGAPAGGEPPRWPLGLAVGLLALAGALAAFVSDWFVVALQPAMDTLGVSQIFAGLVVVAIAGNAIENVVGVQLAAKNESAYAFSIILNSLRSRSRWCWRRSWCWSATSSGWRPCPWCCRRCWWSAWCSPSCSRRSSPSTASPRGSKARR
jgi:Ca2+:H+ antiporter